MKPRLPHNLIRTTAPTSEPFSLDAAKYHCNVEQEETYFNSWFQGGVDSNVGAIAAARDAVERDTRLAFMPQTWQLKLKAWPAGMDAIDTIIHPVQSATCSYTDEDDASQTWATTNFEVTRSDHRSWIVKTDTSEDFPSLSSTAPWPITFTLTCGYHDPTNDTTVTKQRAKVPDMAKMAMFMLLGYWFKNRESIQIGVALTAIESSYRSLIETIRPHRYA